MTRTLPDCLCQGKRFCCSPTAGLHFTDEIFTKLKEKGVTVVDVTLHVGLGTFRPMDTEDVEDHDMHSEVLLHV